LDKKVLINNPGMLYYSSFTTAIGLVCIVKSLKGVCQISFPYRTAGEIEELFRHNTSRYAKVPTTDTIYQRSDARLKYEKNLLKAYFQGKRVDFDFPLDFGNGTPFQVMVWEKLREIPYGECRSYKWVAEQIGRPRAARAVGMANNKNPLPPVVPCHRVIGSDGSLTGYASGLDVKKYLLEMEKGILG